MDTSVKVRVVFIPKLGMTTDKMNLRETFELDFPISLFSRMVKMYVIHHPDPRFGILMDLFKKIEHERGYTDQLLTRGSQYL